MNETLQAYFLSVGEVLSRHDAAFRQEHPEVEGIDTVFVAEVTIDGQVLLGSICSIESTKDLPESDLLNARRSMVLCAEFIKGCVS